MPFNWNSPIGVFDSGIGRNYPLYPSGIYHSLRSGMLRDPPNIEEKVKIDTPNFH